MVCGLLPPDGGTIVVRRRPIEALTAWEASASVGCVPQLNEALLAKAHAARLMKTTRVRADTMVIEANVGYPTDSGLLAGEVSLQP